ncbi:transferase [Sphingobium sp. SCG-1]|uniref:spermine/spermidine synthase domain-containing protein n=1 Tax=Sphingobium sp. SCG-1 TaxID=2072936 RepID=UPI0016701FFA|nr:transferase [Sphingobium sp. SCG-1]
MPPSSAHSGPYIAEFGDSRSLHFDHRTIQSSMCMSDPLSLEFDYIRMMMGFLLFNPKPGIIDMIGLGGGSLAKYCYYRVPSSVITAVEISREVIALRSRFFIPEDNRRLKVLWGDGADYRRQDRRRADVLLVDGFDINGQPPQLCSQEFYEDCYFHLAPGGILVANLWEKHQLCVNRLRKAFGNAIVVVQTERGDNRAVFARKGSNRSLSPDYEAVRLVHGGRHAGFLPQVAERIAKQVARRKLITEIGKALSPAIQPNGAAA